MKGMKRGMVNTKKVLSDRKLVASVAGAVAVLGASDVQAAPIYSGVQDIAINLDSTVDLDLDGDSVIDYAFRNLLDLDSGVRQLDLLASGTNEAVVFAAVPTPLSEGVSLPGDQKFGTPTGAMVQSVSGGVDSWLEAPNQYLGLRFDIAGATHYGWARLTVNADTTATLHDWAYESRAGRGIATGQTTVPEPGTLALLALGAAGVGAMRTRRKRQGEAAPRADEN